MELTIQTTKRSEIKDITSRVQQAIKENSFENGLCLISVPHTTAAITINENADPSVKTDIINILDRLVPFSRAYQHLEGNSDAHVKSSMFGYSELVMVENSRLLLGQWQGIMFCEFDGPRTRKININFLNQTF